MKPGDMKRMFNPKTIALIGATEKEGSIGSAVMQPPPVKGQKGIRNQSEQKNSYGYRMFQKPFKHF
jgi:hypothetical protein